MLLDLEDTWMVGTCALHFVVGGVFIQRWWWGRGGSFFFVWCTCMLARLCKPWGTHSAHVLYRQHYNVYVLADESTYIWLLSVIELIRRGLLNWTHTLQWAQGHKLSLSKYKFLPAQLYWRKKTTTNKQVTCSVCCHWWTVACFPHTAGMNVVVHCPWCVHCHDVCAWSRCVHGCDVCIVALHIYSWTPKPWIQK